MAGTRWVRVDTGYLRNPKVAAVSTPAVLMHLASILWTADQLTDGDIPGHVLGDIAHMARVPSPKAAHRADELVDAGLWIANGGSWHLHDFDVMNEQAMRANVERQRERWRDRQARHRGGGTA